MSAPVPLGDPAPTGSAADRLRALSGELLGVPETALRPDAALSDDLAVDSLAAIEWGMAIEDAFGVRLPDDAWQQVRSYGDVQALLTRLLGSPA